MTTTTAPATHYQVHRGGPRCFYIQCAATGTLHALPFTSKRLAQQKVDERNARSTRCACA